MPALNTFIQREINKLEQTSGYIELYVLDASAVNGIVYRFTNNTSATGGPLVFGGVTYQPIPIMTEGFDITSTGTLPKPVLSIGNTSKTLLNAVITFGDLVGAKLIRYRTYEKFLDGQPTANPQAFIGPETWVVEQMVHRDATMIQWTLTTSIDKLGFKFGRQILKDKSVKHLYAPGIARSRV